MNFTGLTDFALPMEIICFFETSDPDKFAESRHTRLLALLEVVEFFGAFAAPPKRASSG